jgi:hypothetical protein
MKITKQQLRQIIKEEVSRMLNENDYQDMFDNSRWKSLWGGPNDGFQGTPSGEYDGLLAMRKKAEAEGNKGDVVYYRRKLKELVATQENNDNIHFGSGRKPFPPKY